MTEMWLVPVALRILICNTLYPWFFKAKILNTVKGNDVAFVRFFTFHYFFAALLGFLTALWLGQTKPDKLLVVIMIIGAANGYAAYCQWKVDQYSLAFAGLTFFMDDVIAMTLGYTVLNETKYLNPGMITGLSFCAVAITLVVYRKYQKGAGDEHGVTPKLLFYVLAYTTIWGFAKFSIRYFTLSDPSIIGKWVFGWYGGAFIVAMIIFFFSEFLSNKTRDVKPIPLPQMTWKSAVAGAVIFSGVFLAFWAFTTAPITVVNPIFFTAQMVPRMLIGLYIFKEIKQFDSLEKSYMALSIIGAAIIALSYK